MAAGKFIISEIPPGGHAGQGEVFTWTADSEMPTPLGGARAAPRGSWDTGVSLRSVRTDYPGAKMPSKQVLGSREEPFTWAGEFDDRFNFPGYAIAEEERLLDVFRRGNSVKVEFQNKAYVGFMDHVTTRRMLSWKIGYSIAFDVHAPADAAKWDREPVAILNPIEELDALNLMAADMADAHARKPALSLGTAATDISEGLARVSDRLAGVSATLDTKTGVLSPIGDFRTIAMQMRGVQGDCAAVLAKLIGVRSDLDVGYRSAAAVLEFEAWSRDMRMLLRLAIGRSGTAARRLDERDISKASRVYRPRAGEHLYHVSQMAYGTPNRARDIQVANGLNSWTLTGNEILLIPDGSVAK